MGRKKPHISKTTTESDKPCKIDVLQLWQLPEEYGWLGLAEAPQFSVFFLTPDDSSWGQVKKAIYLVLPQTINEGDVSISGARFQGYGRTTGRNIRRLIQRLNRIYDMHQEEFLQKKKEEEL